MFDNLDLVILKTLITNKKFALDFVIENDSKLFSSDVWNFSNIILNYIKTYKELPTLRIIIEKLSKGNNDKLIEHINKVWSELEKLDYDDKEYKYDLERLKKRFAEKQISSLKDTLSNLEPGAMDISKTLGEIQKITQSIKNLSKIKAFEKRTLKDNVPIFKEKYNAKLNNPNLDRGIKTGYSFLDHTTGGINNNELLIIGAESGVGKSFFLMNMAIQMWMQNNTINQLSNWNQGYNILYFSLEMPYGSCFNRILSRLSGLQSRKIRDVCLDSSEILKLKEALKFINKYPYVFEIIDLPRGATIETIEQIYEESKIYFEPHIVVIDYLGLMEYNDPSLDDWLKLGMLSSGCHEFCRIHNCIMLTAAQLNRTKGKEIEDKIGMHRIGRSALIMHNANIAIQLNNRQNEKNYPDMEYYIIKSRDSELGKGRLLKNLACASLLDADNKEEMECKEYCSDDISEKIGLIDI